jgi:hypothetical protein
VKEKRGSSGFSSGSGVIIASPRKVSGAKTKAFFQFSRVSAAGGTGDGVAGEGSGPRGAPMQSLKL